MNTAWTGPFSTLRSRLLLASVGLAVMALAGFWLLLRDPQANTVAQRPPVPEYDFEYGKRLMEETVEVDARSPPKVVKPRRLYIWTEDVWKRGKNLEKVRAELLFAGMQVELHESAKKRRFHLRLGPFESVSERNNAREHLIKRNLKVLLIQPPGKS